MATLPKPVDREVSLQDLVRRHAHEMAIRNGPTPVEDMDPVMLVALAETAKTPRRKRRPKLRLVRGGKAQ